ncbi:MAG: glycosyl transferase [Phycisphaerae bacterium]|nr:glycosyl transferase [Phycisphaerae bacterium]
MFAKMKLVMPHSLTNAVRPAYHKYVVTRNALLLRLYGDREMVCRHFAEKHGRRPNMEEPRTFNEKIAWIKLHTRDPLMVQCADKCMVREYVRNAIGDEYLIPLLGVYQHVSEIPFERLPPRFVLKATHGSGCNIICRDKASLKVTMAKRKLERWLHLNYYYFGYEWAYRDIQPRIVCEELLLDEREDVPRDYKVFCFNGEPRLIQVDVDRFSNHRQSIYDTSWVLQPFTHAYASRKEAQECPQTLRLMLECSRALAKPFAFVRVDLYTIEDRVYFGEMTFYPGGAGGHILPEEYDQSIGDMLTLKSSLRDPAV